MVPYFKTLVEKTQKQKEFQFIGATSLNQEFGYISFGPKLRKEEKKKKKKKKVRVVLFHKLLAP